MPRAALAPLRSPVVAADDGTMLDLVATLAGGRDAAPTVARPAAARCFIEEHLTDPGLGAVRVAAATGISERHLSRVFAAGGTRVPRHVLSRRLQLAYAMHAFRERFGLRAGDVRRGARP